MPTPRFKLPWIAEYQRQAFFNNRRYSVIPASTKAGKTVGALLRLYYEALSKRGGLNRKFWWIAPSRSQAKVAFDRTVHAQKELACVRPFLSKQNNNDLTVTLLNGSVLEFKTGEKPELLYGDDVHFAVVDEASRVRKEAWIALRSTLTHTKGGVIFVGNIKGRSNFFYEFHEYARRAQDPDWFTTIITAKDAVAAGILEQKEIDDAKRDLPAAAFKELYECEPSGDTGCPFPQEALDRGVQAPAPTDLNPVAFGVDLAKVQDYTVVCGLNQYGEVVKFDRFQLDWPGTVDRVAALTRGTPTLVDQTGVGNPILDYLQEQDPNGYFGYKFTNSSKQRLLEDLRLAVEQGTISWSGNETLDEELRFFEYTRTGSVVRYEAQRGYHDDAVIALALAHQLANNDYSNAPPPTYWRPALCWFGDDDLGNP